MADRHTPLGPEDWFFVLVLGTAVIALLILGY